MLSNSNKIRATNTLRMAIVAGIVSLGALYFKVPSNILVLKLLVIPMFWFSLLGLRALYKDPIEKQAVFSTNVLEYHALYVFIFAVFMLLFCWTPSVELSQIFKGAIGAFSIGFPLSLFLHHKNLSVNAV